MENWMTYIVECALCLALLYLPFWGLLRKETFFRFNRYALLAISILSFILPLINIPEVTFQLTDHEILSIQLDEINVVMNGKATSASQLGNYSCSRLPIGSHSLLALQDIRPDTHDSLHPERMSLDAKGKRHPHTLPCPRHRSFQLDEPHRHLRERL